MMSAEPVPQEPFSIDAALEDCLVQADGEGVLLQTALERLGPASFCFVSLLLSVLFIQPFSLGPLTMASALTFMAAGWQMVRRAQYPRLPKRMRDARLHGKGWKMVLAFCQKTLRFCRKFTRPRLQQWVSGDRGEQFIGWLILIGGFLVAIPAANLPLNNTLPALMVLFAAIAWLEKDGLMIFISLAWGVLTLLYFLIVGLALWFFGEQVAGWMHAFWGHFWK